MTTFDDLEISNWQGEPITLYEFHRTSDGTDFYWRYNSSDRDITYSGNVFKAVPISDDGIRQNQEASSTQLTVSMPVAEDFPQMFRQAGSVPSDSVWLTVYRVHFSLLSDARVDWVGTVISISQTDEIKVQIVCNMLLASFKRGGLRLSWTRACPHVLYDSQCRADPNLFKLTGPISGFTGNTISCSAFSGEPDHWLDGGWVQWVLTSGLTERRWIKSHVGSTITISGNTFGISNGDTVTAFAGCAHTSDACVNKFNNLPNYGGFQNMPGKSPFSGNPVF